MDRLPPGQRWVPKLPVLHEGGVPEIGAADWTFFIRGLTAGAEESVVDSELFKRLKRTRIVEDFHCVTHFSVMDMEWEGVLFRDLAALNPPSDKARYAMIHCHGGYSTNLPLDVLMRDETILADTMNGEPLRPEHGGPVRLVVPVRYAWKSAKWVSGVEYMEKDRPGFWESRGYHNDGDPWEEERYS